MPKAQVLTAVMEKVSRLLEDKGALSKNAIQGTIGGRATTVRTAIEFLEKEAFIAIEKDVTGKAFACRSVHPYRDGSESDT